MSYVFFSLFDIAHENKRKVKTTNQQQRYETIKDINISPGISNTNEIHYLKPRPCIQQPYIDLSDINVVCLRQQNKNVANSLYLSGQ